MKKPHKRRIFSAEEKAELLNEYDALPEGRTGDREKWKKERRLSWWLMSGWRTNPKVKAAMRNGKRNDSQISQAQPLPRVPRVHITDLPELNLEPKENGLKRQFTLRQKADILAQWDALPVGSTDRGEFARKYGLTWGSFARWRGDLKRKGIPIPNLKLGPTMNGHADVPHRLPHKGGPRPGAGRPRRLADVYPGNTAKKNSGGHFQTADDVIDWLAIREEETKKIREELIQHAGKTRNE